MKVSPELDQQYPELKRIVKNLDLILKHVKHLPEIKRDIAEIKSWEPIIKSIRVPETED